MHTQQTQEAIKNVIMYVGINALWKYMKALFLQQKLNNYHLTEHTQMSLMKVSLIIFTKIIFTKVIITNVIFNKMIRTKVIITKILITKTILTKLS